LVKAITASGTKASVVINPEKPGRGNFIVRVNGNPIVDLRGLKRPFTDLRELDFDEVEKKLLAAISEQS